MPLLFASPEATEMATWNKQDKWFQLAVPTKCRKTIENADVFCFHKRSHAIEG